MLMGPPNSDLSGLNVITHVNCLEEYGISYTFVVINIILLSCYLKGETERLLTEMRSHVELLSL